MVRPAVPVPDQRAVVAAGHRPIVAGLVGVARPEVAPTRPDWPRAERNSGRCRRCWLPSMRMPGTSASRARAVGSTSSRSPGALASRSSSASSVRYWLCATRISVSGARAPVRRRRWCRPPRPRRRRRAAASTSAWAPSGSVDAGIHPAAGSRRGQVGADRGDDREHHQRQHHPGQERQRRHRSRGAGRAEVVVIAPAPRIDARRGARTRRRGSERDRRWSSRSAIIW